MFFVIERHDVIAKVDAISLTDEQNHCSNRSVVVYGLG
jgi:hypothetical protein